MSEVTSNKAEGLDSQTFLTALVTNTGILAVEVVAFIILKHRLTRIYEPRTYLPPPEYVILLQLPTRGRIDTPRNVGNVQLICLVDHGDG